MQTRTSTPEETPVTPDTPLGHKGELEMRRRFPRHYHWNADNLPLMMQPTISPALARFIEAQPFFFIATANASGHCDASFRGRNYDETGHPLPALKVVDPQQLVFPDYAGNGLYNSLGNVLTNPHIGHALHGFHTPAACTHQRRRSDF